AFCCAVVAKAVLELAQDRFLAVPAHADDEGYAELFAIGTVEPVEGGEFVRRESVEPRARLLMLGVGGHRSLAGGFSGKIRMAVDERHLAGIAVAAHNGGHRLIKRVQAWK